MFGKVKQVTGPELKDATGNIETITFAYDAAGNRIMKSIAYKTPNADKNYIDWYLRDGSGNTMAVYKEQQNALETRQKEVMLYGSDRLGTYKADQLINWAENSTCSTGIASRGQKGYELKDHLGNVRAVVKRQR